MKMTLMALAFLFCAARLHASIGETESELTKRYGPETGSFKPDAGKFIRKEYEFGVYHVSVTLLEGVSNSEVFTRKDKKPIDPIDMQGFLDANDLGAKWEKKDDNKDVTIWVLDSRQGFAGYYKSINSLVIKTQDMLAFEEALMKAETSQQPHPPAQDPKLKP
ncbi:MAG TPA: hypothetical protein VG733_09075 [Chthoniobacteraceae bacterium]|nr:hypothetical protein [Chthoniobacteraceae bacterium]